jgi:hypothetical protein
MTQRASRPSFEQPIDVRADYALIATSVAGVLIALVYLLLL